MDASIFLTLKLFISFGLHLLTLLRRRTYRLNSVKINNLMNSLPNSRITLVDIGSAGGLSPRWQRVRHRLRLFGFEPDERSFKQLIQHLDDGSDHSIFPSAIGAEESEMFFLLTRKPEVSSTLRPNRKFLNLFPDSERFDILSSLRVSAKPLDDFQLSSPDFLKIDIQGGELNALRGCGGYLKNDLIGLEIEVEFLPLYENQPLFGDVVSFLDGFQFQFIDFVNLRRWERTELSGFGQLVHGDALFLKTPEVLLASEIGINKLSSYLGCLFLYNRFDLISRTLDLIPLEDKENFSNFELLLKPLAKQFDACKKISQITNLAVSSYSSDAYTHLIY